MKPTEELKAEHQAVKMTLKVLETMCRRMDQAGGALDVSDADQLLEFFSVFVDKCHHGKEEELLFPALQAAGVPREGGPIGVMLAEHERGRVLVRKMNESLSQIKAQHAAGAATFIAAARGYIELLDQHTNKEDMVLFPMAEKLLSDATQEELAQGFERIEVEKIGAGRHEEFHRMLDYLKGVYLE